ncbi:sterol glucosyltransferase [Cavenderia fasciculata]|uniref:sterol 3beta-glucosyltransferase n=1 Tax=Cavenderia fasciculata TaxID=261658 RepID=F4Q948_CACFS|nr:sterol glucosyltransferase [Cavenderia fasciculata]EGG15217.1 sterol glucosyltransferase [Cavenderia fasciculata]|eukprot:XP_004351937.1 sterol glucosyltransferase [Cavenderia fasciculata]
MNSTTTTTTTTTSSTHNHDNNNNTTLLGDYTTHKIPYDLIFIFLIGSLSILTYFIYWLVTYLLNTHLCGNTTTMYKKIPQISIDSLSSLSKSVLHSSSQSINDTDDDLSDYVSINESVLHHHQQLQQQREGHSHSHSHGHSLSSSSSSSTTTTHFNIPKCVFFEHPSGSGVVADDDLENDQPIIIDNQPVTIEELKQRVIKELADNDLWKSPVDTRILALVDCSLLHNHLTNANLIITSTSLCFLPTEQVHKGHAVESYLHMKAKSDFFWKKYWFHLSGGSLSWYRSSEHKEIYYPNGSIQLKKITSIQKLPSESATRPFCLQIATNAQIYLIQADSETQLDQWFSEIVHIQRNLTISLSLSDIVTMQMESDAALFFDSIYITLKRGDNFIITPSSRPNEIYNLLLSAWGKSKKLESIDQNTNINNNQTSNNNNNNNNRQTIEFQKVFKLNQFVNIILEKPCILFNDIETSYEGVVYAAEDGLYFNSDHNQNGSVALIIPVNDIISIQIDPESDIPEAIKVVTKEYEAYYFDLFDDHESFYESIVSIFTQFNPAIKYGKQGEDFFIKQQQVMKSEEEEEKEKENDSRWFHLPVIPISIPKSIPTRLFRSKSSPASVSPPLNTTPPNGSPLNSQSPSIHSTNSSPALSQQLSSLNLHDTSRTIFIQKGSPQNIQSELHQLFPTLPLNEAVQMYQSCTLHYDHMTNVSIEGHIYVTKSYVAFAPINSQSSSSLTSSTSFKSITPSSSPLSSSSFHLYNHNQNNNNNNNNSNSNKDNSSHNKKRLMKALIPFEDVVSIKKDRTIFLKHCIKIITNDHKWIFGSLNNFYSLYKILLVNWTPINEGLFTPLQSNQIREKFGLPSDEPLITWYNCTNFRGAQLKYGVLYITKHYLCFRSKLGFKKRTIVVPFSSIVSIKKYSGTILPNGIKITTTQQDIDFASFLHRGRVYRQLIECWNDNRGTLQKSTNNTSISNNSSGNNNGQKIGGGGIPKLNIDRIQVTSASTSPLVISPTVQSPRTNLNITILTIGSRGDIQPFIALALTLKNAGHNVVFASHELYRSIIIDTYGLTFKPLSGDPKELMDLCVRNGIFTPKFIKEALSRFRQFIDDLLNSCWEAAQGADALIATPGCFAGPHIAEALQIPFFHAFTMPFTRTRMYPNPFAPFAASQLGGVFNLATHMMMEKILWQPISGQINSWRVERLKLPAWNSSVSINETYRLPYLYCFSKYLVPKPSDWGSEICITGYWFMNETNMPEDKDHPPSQELIDFIERGDAPVYIGFGSIVIEDPNELSRLLQEAVKLSGRRAIISQGWGGLNIDQQVGSTAADAEFVQKNIFLLKQPVAHTWLFEKMSLVIHHGGAGTTAAGIYAGKPCIIVPFFGDQFFWGERVQDMGIGQSLSSKTLSAKSLASSINELIDSKSAHIRVKEMANHIRNEKGLKQSLQDFYRYLNVAYVPPSKTPMGSKTSCRQCKQGFGLLNQMVNPLVQTKFHCHCCGQVFCDKCTLNKIPLPKFRINIPVRVCDTCYSNQFTSNSNNI